MLSALSKVITDTGKQSEEGAGSKDLRLNGNCVDPNSGSFPAEIGLAAQLFDALTDISNVDHPICRDCMEELFDFLEEECNCIEDEVCTRMET